MSAGAATSIGIHLGDESQPSINGPLDSDGLFVSVRLSDVAILYGRSPDALRRYAAALATCADALERAQREEAAASRPMTTPTPSTRRPGA